MKTIYLLSLTFLILVFTSCSVSKLSMKQPNNHIEFYKNDFEYSPQVTGSATSVKILGVDWKRLFNNQSGVVDGESYNQQKSANVQLAGEPIVTDMATVFISAFIPVLGDYINNNDNHLALHDLMKKHPGYDIVIYPQFEIKKKYFPLIYSKTEIKVKARLGKIKD